MSHFIHEWKALSVRIKGLSNASNALFNALKVQNEDNFSIKYLVKSSHEIFTILKEKFLSDRFCPEEIKKNS